MAKLEKPFIPVEEQVQKLKDRGLIIENEDRARVHLLRTSYYDLVNGYKDMFLMEKTVPSEEDVFKEGTTLEDIAELYKLDRKIRHAVLEVLLDVECVFYSALAYSIASQYGEKHIDYLKVTNYKEGDIQDNNKSVRENLLSQLNYKIKKPSVEPLIYYKEKYDNIPPWILVKDLSFGQLVKLYKVSKPAVKNQVIETITGNVPTEKDKEFFIKCLELLNKFRNWAAHGGRIYNHKTSIELPYWVELHNVMDISKNKHRKGNGRSDFAAVVIGVIYFFKKDPESSKEFFFSLSDSLQEYRKKKPLEYEGVLNELGIPREFYDNAMKELLYKDIPVV